MNWSPETFGSILNRVERFEERNPSTTYQFSGTYSFGKGIFLNQKKKGSEFALEHIQRIKQGDFVYCKIMAWEGGFGVAPKECDNTVMSGAFVVYEINKKKVLPEFLNYYFKLEKVWKSIGGKSTGTNLRRRSLHPDDFEKQSIPLPPLSIQQSIVKKLEAVKSKCDTALQLRHLAEKEVEALRESFSKQLFDELAENFGTITVDESELEINPESINPSATLKQKHFTYIDIGSVEQKSGKIIEGKKIKGTNAPSRARRLMKTNDVVMAAVRPNLKKVFVVNDELNKQVCSTGFTILRGKADYVLPDFLRYQLISDFFINQCKVTGGHYPAINDDNLRKVRVVIPSVEIQQRAIDEIYLLSQKISQIKTHQQLTSTELKGLFPSVLDRAFKGEL